MVRAAICTTLVLILAAATVVLCVEEEEQEGGPKGVSPETRAQIDALPDVPPVEMFERLQPLHKPKREPGPADWLAHHDESGQDFYRYFLSRPVRPTEKRGTIYISLLGDFSPEQKKIIELTAAYMEVYFGVPVRFHDPIPLNTIPAEARRVHPQWGVKQILASHILLNVLKPRLPDDALAYIAFTSSDLWPGEGWNFVFGMAMLRLRVGVWSIFRYGDPAGSEASFRRCLLRTMKVGTHETGHMLSMYHCIAHECNMNGSNHLPEMDRAPLLLCPECLRKLIYATGVEGSRRFRGLAAFCEANGFEQRAALFERSAQLFDNKEEEGPGACEEPLIP